MADIEFGTLKFIPVREAWENEALEFTPWLAKNINQLSDVVGMELELTGQEVRVETFAADILARNAYDDSVVLIENQLEHSDHTHLGQILTYLAGLKAKTVIWIAPEFRSPHLSAIRWLNENTVEGFSFFAIKVGVVRIGDSPVAPIFELVEQPNDWDRAVNKKAQNAQSDVARARVKFWEMYLEKYPEAARTSVRVNGTSNMWFKVLPEKLLLGRYIASNTSGVYLRGPFRSDIDNTSALLEPHREIIESRLGVELGPEDSWFAMKSAPYPIGDENHWPDAIEFMETNTKDYLVLLNEIFSGDDA